MQLNFKKCSVDGCEANAHWRSGGKRNMCNAHYLRVRIHGSPQANFRDGKKSADFILCSVNGCSGNAARRENGKRGLCSMHYQRLRHHGDAAYVRPQSPTQIWINGHLEYSGSDCLIWPFHIGKDGYGRAHHPKTGKLTTASALMCEAVHGPKPTPRHECAHSCGKGHDACVHPLHVRWDTPEGNQADRLAHGTDNRGEKHGSSRLTSEDVIDIRSMANEMSQARIAEIYGVDQSHISRIMSRQTWAWLD